MSGFPEGWDEERVRSVLAHYEQQAEEEAVAEDEAALADQNETVMVVPRHLVSVVRELIAKHHEQPYEGGAGAGSAWMR